MILIFGGTTEGRMAVDVCDKAGSPFIYSTKEGLQDVRMLHGKAASGVMTRKDIVAVCQAEGVQCIVDASHPFAERLHSTIAEAMEELGLAVIRIQRKFGPEDRAFVYCDDWDAALKEISNKPATRLLALTGANTIMRLKPYWERHDTFFRIMRREQSLSTARVAGFPTDRLIYYPDDKAMPTIEDEIAMMRKTGCDTIVTKESGENGGFGTKTEAAKRLGLRVIVIRHPRLPETWTYVTGPIGLRRAIEQAVPTFFAQKTGLTTGTCATAVVKAAVGVMTGVIVDGKEPVDVELPSGESIPVKIESVRRGDGFAEADIIKDYSDDPDVTRGCRITAHVKWGTGGIRFIRGEGVGTVTLPGLGIAIGEPAINPTPREMMSKAIRQMTDRSVDVTLSIENGQEIARRTLNTRLGVVGGLSIIGSTGVVMPLSDEAFIRSIRREMEVARALGCREIGLASGKKGEDALRSSHEHLRVIHYGNFIGEALKAAKEIGFESVIVGIMIGKAVKLAEGKMDTHSHKNTMNQTFLRDVAKRVCPDYADKIATIDMARDLWGVMPATFFDEITRLCHVHCQAEFTPGRVEIKLVCDKD